MKTRNRPVIYAKCEKCGNAFFASVFGPNMMTDLEGWNEITKYAAEGYQMVVCNAGEYVWCSCSSEKK